MSMIWGIDSSGVINKEILEPLGLFCYGGRTAIKFWKNKKPNGMTYHVYNADKSFDFDFDYNDFKNIEKIYKEWIKSNRKEKLIKINKN